MPTFKTEALRLVSNVQLVKRLLPCNKRQVRHYLALLIARGADTQTHKHTHTHTDVRMKVISSNQARAGLRPARAWFKNYSLDKYNYGRLLMSFDIKKND